MSKRGLLVVLASLLLCATTTYASGNKPDEGDISSEVSGAVALIGASLIQSQMPKAVTGCLLPVYYPFSAMGNLIDGKIEARDVEYRVFSTAQPYAASYDIDLDEVSDIPGSSCGILPGLVAQWHEALALMTHLDLETGGLVTTPPAVVVIGTLNDGGYWILSDDILTNFSELTKNVDQVIASATAIGTKVLIQEYPPFSDEQVLFIIELLAMDERETILVTPEDYHDWAADFKAYYESNPNVLLYNPWENGVSFVDPAEEVDAILWGLHPDAESMEDATEVTKDVIECALKRGIEKC